MSLNLKRKFIAIVVAFTMVAGLVLPVMEADRADAKSPRAYTTSYKVKPRKVKSLYTKYILPVASTPKRTKSGYAKEIRLDENVVVGWSASSVSGASPQYAPKIHYQVNIYRRAPGNDNYKYLRNRSGTTSWPSYKFESDNEKANYRIQIRPYVLRKVKGKYSRVYAPSTYEYITKVGGDLTHLTYVKLFKGESAPSNRRLYRLQGSYKSQWIDMHGYSYKYTYTMDSDATKYYQKAIYYPKEDYSPYGLKLKARERKGYILERTWNYKETSIYVGKVIFPEGTYYIK